ncbi:excisionase [Paraburkholderia fynbosensis]|uniref:Excisionase-like domain-containing protein n=1 Tax=Paraburkholderia fynbosensis TaxID=1200993 RepID=A0A6J5FNU5_9BURK|nr:excisionase [Paraburkholderia fynbosensis]CAB3782179.1 hypothetical protein LMG27177_01184 [Paraburkholderia fynbosensis]
MGKTKVGHWLPLEEAATIMNRSLRIIKSQMRNGRIQRDRHFRRVGDGQFELNLTEYLDWLNEEKERRKLPLLERVRLSIEDGDRKIIQAVAATQKKVAAPAEAPEASERRGPKLIPLNVWAEEMFGGYAPPVRTLRSWIRAGKIYPMPVKIGRSYFVKPDAEYVDPLVQKFRRSIGRY